MKVVIGNDHAAVQLKHEIIQYLESKEEICILDGCTYNNKDMEYPDYAREVCNKVLSGEYDCGILLCGTGVGMSMAANKMRGIRAVVCSDPCSAKFSRAHNDANILCLGARVVGAELAKTIVDVFLSQPFEGGRHTIRVAKIMELENL